MKLYKSFSRVFLPAAGRVPSNRPPNISKLIPRYVATSLTIPEFLLNVSSMNRMFIDLGVIGSGDLEKTTNKFLSDVQQIANTYRHAIVKRNSQDKHRLRNPVKKLWKQNGKQFFAS